MQLEVVNPHIQVEPDNYPVSIGVSIDPRYQTIYADISTYHNPNNLSQKHLEKAELRRKGDFVVLIAYRWRDSPPPFGWHEAEILWSWEIA